jgi:hypothetical protein
VEIKLAQYSSTKGAFRKEWRFGVWWGLFPLVPINIVVPNKPYEGISGGPQSSVRSGLCGQKMGKL